MSQIPLFLGCLCALMGFAVPFIHTPRSVQRRIFWGCTSLASAFGFATFSPDLKNSFAMAGSFAFAMVLMAFQSTPYIKIGGKIYALTIGDRQPDPEDAPTSSEPDDPEFDAYPNSYSGLLTAATTWWLLVIVAVIAAVNFYFFAVGRGGTLAALVGVALVVLLSAGAGFGDASWAYPVARKQYLPFAIASVITAGSVALTYLAGYAAGRKWPLRRTQSMEYRAHPRHQKQRDVIAHRDESTDC